MTQIAIGMIVVALGLEAIDRREHRSVRLLRYRCESRDRCCSVMTLGQSTERIPETLVFPACNTYVVINCQSTFYTGGHRTTPFRVPGH